MSSNNNTNINKKTRKNQIVLAILIGLGLAVSGGSVFYLNKINQEKTGSQPVFEEDEKTLEPDLTGSVSSTFDGQVASQIVTDVQTESKAYREALNEVLNKLKSVEDHLEAYQKDNEALRKRIEENERVHNDFISAVASQKDNEPEPTYEPVSDQGVTASRKTNTSTNQQQANYQVQNGYIELSQPKPVKGSFERKTYSKKNDGSSSSGSFYVPSGAFANAIILEGADANASVTAQQNDVTPMQFKLTGKLHLPSNKKNSKLVGCFVTAGTYGDISSERAIVRLNRLSCLINGKHIDQPVKGHVAFYGKNGIKGVPVMRNGKILGLAFASGALSGIGGAVSAIGDTQSGLGAARSIGGAEVLREALGGGTTTAANKLADYYIQRAEQYHPVIPIGSANRVEVVFTEGFWAKFIEDTAVEEDKNITEQPTNQQQNNNVVPKELENQLGEIKNQSLSDFVTPNQPIK